MAKSARRQKTMAAKRQRKASQMKNSGGRSHYARKRAYCIRNNVWGFNVPEPKPWRESA